MSEEPLVNKMKRSSILLVDGLDGAEDILQLKTLHMRNIAILLTSFQLLVSIGGLLLYFVRKSKGYSIISVSDHKYHCASTGDYWIRRGSVHKKDANHHTLNYHHIRGWLVLCV